MVEILEYIMGLLRCILAGCSVLLNPYPAHSKRGSSGVGSSRVFILAFFIALSFARMETGIAARHLLETTPTPPSPTTTLDPEPHSPPLPSSITLAQAPALPPLPTIPTIPPVPQPTLPPLPAASSLPNIPPTIPSIPFLSPPTSTISP